MTGKLIKVRPMRESLAPFLCALLLAAACAPPAPSPTAPPKPTAPPAKPAASPAGKPAEKAPAKAEAKPPAQPDWQQEWERTLAAGRQEGKVSVMIPSGIEAQEALVEPFQQKYGIQVDFQSGSARELVPRLSTEREAGQFLWDVLVQGAQFFNVKPLGATEPLEPALILPEVKDKSLWRGGDLQFVDTGDRHVLVMTPFQRGILFVNPNTVRPEEITSHRDLLAPRFRGRLNMYDPRSPGPGQASFQFYYMSPELGPDFIRALAAQQPTILRDWGQQVDAISRERDLVAIGVADFFVEPRIKQGLPLAIIPAPQLKEGTDVSPANGEVTLLNRGPHPNAAKVYLNWLLSKEGQTIFAQKLGYISNRIDVPTDHTFSWRVPRPDAIKTYTAEARTILGEKVLPFLIEVFGPPG